MPFADATELAALVAARELSPVEIMQSHLDRIEAVNPQLNAIVTLDADDPVWPGKKRICERDGQCARLC